MLHLFEWRCFYTFVQFARRLVSVLKLNGMKFIEVCFRLSLRRPLTERFHHGRPSAVFAATPGGWKRPRYNTCLGRNADQRLTNRQFSLCNQKSATSGFRNTEPFDIKEQETMCPLLSPPPAVSCVPAAGLFTSQRRVFPGVARQGKPWRCRVCPCLPISAVRRRDSQDPCLTINESNMQTNRGT